MKPPDVFSMSLEINRKQAFPAENTAEAIRTLFESWELHQKC